MDFDLHACTAFPIIPKILIVMLTCKGRGPDFDRIPALNLGQEAAKR